MPVKSLLDGVFGVLGNAQQNHYNRELAEYQNAFNLEMWNKQNEYNSPLETMKRLTQAGINPRSYNQLGQFANSADAPQAAQYTKQNAFAAYSDMAMTMAQIRNVKADTQKKEAEAAAATSNAETNRGNLEQRKSEFNRRLDVDLKQVGIQEDRVRIAIIDAMENAWLYGHNVGGLGQFNTKFEDGFTLNETLYNILGELTELKKQGYSLGNRGTDLLNGLREVRTLLETGELRSFENIPRELRWLTPILISIFK